MQETNENRANTLELIPYKRLREFGKEVLMALGVSDKHSSYVIDALLYASLLGIDSHGIRLLPHYVRAIKGGRLNPRPEFNFERILPSTARLNADHTLGHIAGMEAVLYAVDMAKDTGIGAVSVYNSSHCGAMGYYAIEGAKRDFIVLCFTNANALLNTPGATRPYLGINPVCISVPLANEPPLCFDAAPSAITWNKLLQIKEKGERLPLNCAADAYGNPTDDPSAATQLLPIGNYKGFGLAMMAEIFCGILSTMPYGRHISDMYKASLSERRYLAQFYMLINISGFIPVELFKERTQEMVDEIRREPPSDKGRPVMVPGDKEKQCQKERFKNGIPIAQYDIKQLRELAIELNIKSFI